MVRGALKLLGGRDIVIINPSNEGSWIEALQITDKERGQISAAAGPIGAFGDQLQPGDVLFFLGADVIDGTCGVAPSFDRLDLITAAILRGHAVYVSCSFRSRVAPEILERLRLTPDAHFLLRDEHSLKNFQQQTRLSGRFFPDFSFFCPPQHSPQAEAAVAAIAAAGEYRPVIGLNFAEHSFRSFFDDHSDVNRDYFVGEILEQLSNAHSEAFFVLLSNDERNWDNYPSDEDYQDRAARWIAAHLGEDRCYKVDPQIGYGGNIVVLGAVDLLVTGRMHLSLAAFRSGTVPLVMMGQSAGYSSVDKMRGAFERHLGTIDAVITELAQLGAASQRFLSERDVLKERMASILLQQTSSNERDVERLMADMEHEAANGERTGSALASALTISTRLSDDLARERALSGELHNRIDHLLVEFAELRRNLDDAKSTSDAALRQAEHRVSTITATGDRLVHELRRAHSKPWRPLCKSLQRSALRFLLLFAPVMPERSADSLRRSLFKRKPVRFQREWDQACGRVVAALPDRPNRPERIKVSLRRRLYLIAMRLLAALVSPVSPRTAARFRRSADKRDPKKIAAVRRALSPDVPLTLEASPGLVEPKVPVSDAGRAKRILVADCRIPRPDVSAGEQATFGLIADLCATGFDVVFCSTDMSDSPPYRQNLEALGVTVITRTSGYHHPADYVRAEGQRFGSFYLIRVDVAEAILPTAREVAPDAFVLFHAPDLYFLREGRAADLSGDSKMRARAEATRARELAIMRAADHIVLVSPAEIPVLAGHISHDKISVFPALYSAVNDAPVGFTPRQHLFFLGGFEHQPNVDAVKWFVSHVWPRVHAALPDVEFHIVGGQAPQEVLDLAKVSSVRHIGYVADLTPVLAGYRLSVAPLRYGAGIKGKLGASLGAGVPSVCTSIAAEGMGIVDGLHALIRDEPEAFADAVIRLYQDEGLWRHIADNGRSLVRETFSESANRSSFLRMLDRARVLPLSLYVEHCQKVSPAPFPVPDTGMPIDVSVIVPVYNNWSLTRACLNSLLIAGRATGLRYEVILADDGSTDETVQAAELYPGLRVVRGESNRGYLLNCKAAAAQASGRHLLFLHNDTVVMPGWLEPLVRTLDADPRIAIAGSKLLYPDGTIQDAGRVLFSDASAGNIGRGHARQARLYSLSREVDYVTGASMLVRGSFWREAEGFDERYVPAYCEDSDLAITARARGYQVLYVADSQVIHFGHGSYAAESVALPKALARANEAKCEAKWGGAFREQQMSPRKPVDIAAAHSERLPPLEALERRRSGKLNVLYFSPFPSHPDNHGNQATIQAFGRHFRELGHKVHFALLQSHMYDEISLAQMRAAWDSIDILPNQCGLGSNGQPIPFDGWYEEGLGQRIRVLCAAYDIDVVFCSYVFQSRLLDYVPAHVLKVIDTHDKMGDRYEMLRKNGQPLEFFSCTPEEEGAYLRRADVVVARRAEEATYFNSVSGRETAIVIPHVEEARFLERSFDKLTDVGMVASANNINLAITLQLLKAIDARLAGGASPFTLHIAGQVRDMIGSLPEEDAGLFSRPWVRLHGFVPDIGSFYRAVDVVVSPVTMGTGINVKTVQAMAYGMPLITTRWGGKGIETGDPMHDHADLDALVAGLLALAADPTRLPALADVSRRRYQAFYDASIEAMEQMFRAVKS